MSASPLRTAVRAAARRLGAEPALELAARAGLRGMASPTVRRNLRDDDQARVVCAAALRRDSSCIDIGANVGTFLELFTALAPEGRHLAFEPVPELRADLGRRFPGVEVRAEALSDREGETTFHLHRALPSRSSLRDVGYAAGETEAITVPVRTLDALIPEGFSPALIKLDVEGAELEVLRGARATLATHRPLLLFEYQARTARHYGAEPEALAAVLAEAGLRIFDMDGHGPYSVAELRAAYARGRPWNFFTAPAA